MNRGFGPKRAVSSEGVPLPTWYNLGASDEESFMRKAVGLAMALMVVASAMIFTGAATSVPSMPVTAPSTQPAKELTLDLGDKVTLKLALIPAGKFIMGSPETEKGRRDNEEQHEVAIPKPFYMGVTHVTVEQFAAFVRESGYKTDDEKTFQSLSLAIEIKDGKLNVILVSGCSWRKPSFTQKGDHPVVHASWFDAQAFCDWLSKKSGKTVTLPTEEQWEYAYRAGTTTAYPWGDNPDDGKGWANCADQSLQKRLPNAPPDWRFFNWDDGFVFTSPTASFKANAFGLYDMTGNAWQLCQNAIEPNEKAPATDPKVAATNPRESIKCVLRGGSWGCDPTYCRSAFRDWLLPLGRGGPDGIGFRVIVAADGD
jgi:formylglycine-generating enzyme